MAARRKRDHPRRLLVEGETDKRVIPYLMEANGVAWPEPPDSPVFIEPYGSVDEILKPSVIESKLAATGLEALGVVVDANGDAAARWDDVRGLGAGVNLLTFRNRYLSEVWRSSTPTVCGSASGSCRTIGSPGCWRTFSSN